jgi:L-lactate dehydrogenase complex protein LldE
VKVALFSTCVAEQLQPNAALSVLRVLRRLGCEVTFSQAQTCCGQPAYNSGFVPQARAVARVLVGAFADAEYVVAPSGSCCGMIRHHFPALFAGTELAEQATALAERIHEFSQFMVNVLGVERLAASFPHRVTYHPSCHGMRLLGARDEPLRLLRAIGDLELVPLLDADTCCGFGGTFCLKLAELSAAIADEKATNVEKTQARYLVSTDLGCLMNISSRMQRRGMRVETLHLAELVDRAMRHAEARSA